MSNATPMWVGCSSRSRLISIEVNPYTAFVTGMPIKDATSGFRVYRAEILKKVRRLEIRSRHLVEDLFAGGRKSVFQGRGIGRRLAPWRTLLRTRRRRERALGSSDRGTA